MEAADGEQPHMALYFVLEYLPLFDLLNMSRTCRSMRDYIREDVLVWLDIIVDRPPINRRLTDDVLIELVSKARGRLRTLALVNCETITDDGLQRIMVDNPYIEKLFVPGCTRLTPECVIRFVRTLTERNSCFKALMISGIHNVTKEHLEILSSYLNHNSSKTKSEDRRTNFYHHTYNKSPLQSINQQHYNYIDVEICPICKEVKIVYDCPKENCKCKGCHHCIPRCKECGMCGCADQELEEVICGDSLCLNCWLTIRPKCSQCNRPYCRQHMQLAVNYEPLEQQCNDFVCEICLSRDEYEAADYEI